MNKEFLYYSFIVHDLREATQKYKLINGVEQNQTNTNYFHYLSSESSNNQKRRQKNKDY